MTKSISKLQSTFDRFDEVHWYIHQMERYYHFADKFRFSFNSFVRCLKEVPQILQIELQNVSGFKEWFKDRHKNLRTDPLVNHLFKTRNFVVHRGMLLPLSKGFIGVIESGRMKFGMSVEIDPLQDSNDAMRGYIEVAKTGRDILGILKPYNEIIPFVRREWKIKYFKDKDLLDVAIAAYYKIGNTLSETSEWIGNISVETSLSCVHSSKRIQVKHYDQNKLIEMSKLSYKPSN